MFGLPLGMLGVAQGSNMPNNTPEDMSSLQKLYAAIVAHNRTPNGRVERGFNQFGPQASQPVAPMAPRPIGPPASPFDGSNTPSSGVLSSANLMNPQPTAVAPQAPPAAPPPAQAGTGAIVPMPAPRPMDAPQAPPEMNWFQRNAAMMRDPSSGQFIDPTNAAIADSQASGPDVINKLLSYFHKEGTPS